MTRFIRSTRADIVCSPVRRAWRGARASARRAFTLIELMVAVGAVAIIAVGLAAVFASVGDTVTGGRAVSSFTAYASLLERQLRDDISKMSREGFLLIVNQEADEGRPVALYPGQVQPLEGRQPAAHQQRPRRIDEMVFFRKGSFTSAREPLGAGFTARGNAAMIYYGHGTRQPVDERLGSTYIFPRVGEGPDHSAMPPPSRRLEPVRLGDPTSVGGGLPNPNRYASEWSLLRLQVTLAPSSGTRRETPELFRLPLAARLDQDTQVGGQPAQRSIFRTLWDYPAPASAGGGGLGTASGTIRSAAIPGETPATSPLLTSGLVDVISSDLDEIRRMVMWSPKPQGSGTSFAFATPANPPSDLLLQADGYDGVIAPYAVQQAWMLDALPAPSAGFRSNLNVSGWSPSTPLPPAWTGDNGDFRVRYEPSPPAYLEPMDLQPLARAVRLADQMALTSPMLAPHCTEFIVEWSFGKVAPDGSLIWHGAERRVDLDGDGSIDPGEVVARPYLDNDEQRFALPYRLLEPAPAGVPQFASEGDLFGSYPVSPQLIHGFTSPSDQWTYESGGRRVLASFFGYVDPTFNPSDPGQPVGLPALPAPFNNAPDSASDYLPWAWPELIRITVSLADPSDPAIEQTFQFVFEAPGNPAP